MMTEAKSVCWVTRETETCGCHVAFGSRLGRVSERVLSFSGRWFFESNPAQVVQSI